MTPHSLVILSALLCVAAPPAYSQIVPLNDVENGAFDIKAGELNTDSPNTTTASLAVNKVLTGNADEDGSRDVSAGDTLSYTITATNDGTANLTGVVVSDNLTGDFTGDGVHPACAEPMVPGATCVLTVDYVIRASDLGTTIHNVGSAVSDQTGRGTTVLRLRVEDNEGPEETLADVAAN